MRIRSLAATLIAATSLAAAAPALAADRPENPTFNGVPCVPMGCTTDADAVDCWIPQTEGWEPAPGEQYRAWRESRVRQRERDGRYEILIRVEAFRCPEVLPGLRVAEEDVPEVVAYLKARALEATGTVEIAGEPVPWALDLHDWQRLADCESGGDWQADTGNGHFGGLQFHPASWAAVGGEGNAADASIAEQIERARMLLDIQGPGAWPVCSKRIGWR